MSFALGNTGRLRFFASLSEESESEDIQIKRVGQNDIFIRNYAGNPFEAVLLKWLARRLIASSSTASCLQKQKRTR